MSDIRDVAPVNEKGAAVTQALGDFLGEGATHGVDSTVGSLPTCAGMRARWEAVEVKPWSTPFQLRFESMPCNDAFHTLNLYILLVCTDCSRLGF